MASNSNKHTIFKSPQKESADTCHSPLTKLNHLRFRSPLANIQMSSVTNSSHFKSENSMRFTSNHCTPPQPFLKIRNPFEKALIDNLHTPICSPGMFKIRESSGSFKWDIEHVSILKPADIVPCCSQFDPTPDPILERKAKEAIEKFFSQEMIVPSPLNEVPKQTNILPMDPPVEHATPEGIKSSSREVWTQTMLTFPAELPPEIQNTLQQFYTFNKDQMGIGDADISANASLRRKLCFEEVFSDAEEECLPPTFHNTSCPTFNSPGVNAFMHGLKRTFDTPLRQDYVQWCEQDKNGLGTLSAEGLHAKLGEFSPIMEASCKLKQRYSGENNALRSPSLSPIGKSPQKKVTRNSLITSPDKQENLSSHHSCNASPFSQSTPEKCTSKSSVKSSLSFTDGSDIEMNIDSSKEFATLKFESFQQREEDFVVRKSKSEGSVASLGSRKSAMKLDFSMEANSDISMNSGDQSLRCHSVIGDSKSNSPKLLQDCHWNKEMHHFILNTQPSSLASCEKCDVNVTKLNSNFKLFPKPNFCDCESAIDEKTDRLKDVFQYLTPTKNKLCSNQNMESTGRNYINVSKSSPSRMSLDSSFNIEVGKIHQNRDSESQIGNSNYISYENTNLINAQPFCLTNLTNKGTPFNRIDSGFNDLYLGNSSILPSCEVTVCNSTRQVDITKSFSCNTETSSVSWKRFDSGFNEETSSDFSNHLSCNEYFKPPKKYSPIFESEENKENIYLHNYHKGADSGQRIHDSMSISEIFAEDMVSFNCNFSSTPSKTFRQSNT